MLLRIGFTSLILLITTGALQAGGTPATQTVDNLMITGTTHRAAAGCRGAGAAA